MAYFAPIHSPTRVSHSLTARFTSTTEDDLVIASLTRIEIWRVSDDSATLTQSRTINGVISAVTKLRPKDSNRDLLFVSTDTQNYVTLSWDETTNQIEGLEAVRSVPSDYLRISENSTRAYTDPTGKFMALLLWEGIISIFRIDDRSRVRKSGKMLQALGQERIAELFVKSACFLPSITGPRLALLFQTRTTDEDAHLAVYSVTKDERHMQIANFDPHLREFTHKFDDPHTNMLILVPNESDENNRYHVRRGTAMANRPYLGGIIAVGETTVEYIDGLNYEIVKSHLPEATAFTSWAQIDNRTYVLGDDFGFLHILRLITEGTVVTQIQTEKLPTQVSRASTLSYVGSGILYLGSCFADSQLIRLDLNKKEVLILNAPISFANNAPILDFAVMDLGNRDQRGSGRADFASGQARIITGSGIWSDGSLRSIRSGVGLDVVGVVDDFPRVENLFSLKKSGSHKTNMLAISTPIDTQVLEVGVDGSIEQVENPNCISLGSPSLLLKHIPGDLILQVTPTVVTLRHTRHGALSIAWTPPKGSEITQAAANTKFAMVVVNGHTIFSLNIQQSLAAVSQDIVSADGSPDQVTCITVPEAFSNVGVVSLWQAGSISFVDMSNLSILATMAVPKAEDSTAYPRDIALVQIHPKSTGHPTLVIAMDDGLVSTFTVSPSDYSVSDMITVVVGVQRGHLHVIPQTGGESNTVLVTSDLSTLIYSDPIKKTLIFSATTLEMASNVAAFDSDAYPDSVVITINGQLWIGNIDNQRRTHIKSLPLKKTVRRLVYMPGQKAFATATIARQIVQNEEVIETTVQLVDEILFRQMGESFILKHLKRPLIPEAIALLEFDDADDGHVERLILGSSTVDSSEETAGGVLTILGFDEEKTLFTLATYRSVSPISTLKVQGNLIFIGVTNGIRVLKYTETTALAGNLEKIASRGSLLSPTAMDVHEDIIGVSDVMKSASFFRLDLNESSPDRIKPIGQHRSSLWPTALAHVAPYRWVQADAEGNVIVLNTEKQEKQEAPVKGAKIPEVDYISAMNLGEQINTVHPLDIALESGGILEGQAIMTTAEGGIYLFGIIVPKYRELVSRLQDIVAAHVQTLGNFSFSEYRAFRHGLEGEKEPVAFVDGQLVERFLEMSESVQDMICEGLSHGVDEVREVLQNLRQLH